jgi:hypothetical protein
MIKTLTGIAVVLECRVDPRAKENGVADAAQVEEALVRHLQQYRRSGKEALDEERLGVQRRDVARQLAHYFHDKLQRN